MFITFKLKRYIAIAAAVAVSATLMITLISCGRNEDIHTRIYRKYSNIDSFSAVVEVTVNTDRTENVYQMRQYYIAPDMFREDVLSPENLEGMTYIFSGGTMLIIPPNDGESVLFEDIPKNRSYTFLPDFFGRYFEIGTEAVPVSAEPTGETAQVDETVTVLEVQLDGDNIYRATQKLWIDNKTLMPIRLETYDADGDPLVVVLFTEFNLNDNIDDEIFNLQR